ncbi:Enolase [Dissostichus eleginoides]|uniref:Enolase n=1 Tax=Dissostichus eleginoides TaxID=100907 RepID=A0AAD9EXU7_DISEL|nr:Enolase [Dissostichus eleginoides]KAK1881061.1 Enolase [Dissostichus eleginoides]
MKGGSAGAAGRRGGLPAGEETGEETERRQVRRQVRRQGGDRAGPEGSSQSESCVLQDVLPACSIPPSVFTFREEALQLLQKYYCMY